MPGQYNLLAERSQGLLAVSGVEERARDDGWAPSVGTWEQNSSCRSLLETKSEAGKQYASLTERRSAQRTALEPSSTCLQYYLAVRQHALHNQSRKIRASAISLVVKKLIPPS